MRAFASDVDPRIEQTRYQQLEAAGRNGFVVVIVQLAPEESVAPDRGGVTKAWEVDYPWFHQALEKIGPGARGASDGWRVRIEDELKTTLDFKVRPDGTAAVWCGMSGYDFRHDPTPKQLFEGLGEAYRRERKRVSDGNQWKMSSARPTSPKRSKSPVQALPGRAADSLGRAVGAVILPRGEQLMLIFFSVTVLTLVLASVAIAVR